MQVVDLTELVGQLMYRMDMQETRVKTEEKQDSGEGHVKKEETA